MTFALLASAPKELADGRYPAPPWLILALGGLVMVGAGVYLGIVLWRRRKKR